jgi:PAS domain S-box-containing protein
MLAEYPQLVEFVPVLVVDQNGQIIAWNAAAQRVYGYGKEEAVGRPCDRLLQTHFGEPPEHIYHQLQERGEWRGQLRQRRRDGREVVVSSWWSAHRDNNGVIDSIFQVNYDVTDLKQMEEALRESENILRVIFNSNRDCILLHKPDGTIQQAGARARPAHAGAGFLPGFHARACGGRALGKSRRGRTLVL